MSYGIWFGWNNEQEGFQIPIMPEGIDIGDGAKNKTYEIVGLGEINVIKNPKLTDYTFSSFFPALGVRVGSDGTDPFVTADLQFAPMEYVDYIKKWMESKRPIHFIFTGDSFDLNTPASIEQFDWKEVAGGNGDIEYSIKLKKYVFYAAQKVTVVKKSLVAASSVQKKSVARANDKQTPSTYTLVAGDNLWKVAKLKLGNGDRWKEIQKLNNIPDSKLKKLSIGLVVKLPQTAGGNYA